MLSTLRALREAGNQALKRVMDFIDAAYFLFKNKIAHTTN